MRVLAVTKIFPNRQQPGAAPYNRLQLGALDVRARVEVAATIPWLPGRGLLRRNEGARIPWRDRIDSLTVTHPRVLYAPRATRSLSGAFGLASLVAQLGHRRGDFDVVLGCFGYPDGWAAVGLAKVLGVPAVIKVHGSDVNILGEDPLVRPLLASAFRRAFAVVGPSQALVDRAVELGANPTTSVMIANGTDRARFHVRDRQQCRAALGHGDDRRRWILFVGRVSQAKGAIDLVEAFDAVLAGQPDCQLVMIGDGSHLDEAKRMARGRPVLFAGSRLPDELPLWHGASDIHCLPSHAEGTPNVVLEALASGRRVVATAVGGIPAVIDDPLLGELVPAKQPALLAQALGRALERPADAAAISAAAPVISWPESADRLYAVLDAAIA
jgi:glycosyltransferase involved in cell wall biosynthesis